MQAISKPDYLHGCLCLYNINCNEPPFHEIANSVVPLIDRDMGIQEFIILCEKFPAYELQYCDKDGITALKQAVSCNNYPLIQHIIEHINPNALNDNLWKGQSALHEALCSGFSGVYGSKHKDFYLEISRMIILKGADVNLASEIVNYGGYNTRGKIIFNISPLYITAHGENVSLTKLLLENGAEKYCIIRNNAMRLLGKNKSKKNYETVKYALRQGTILQQEFSKEGEVTLAKAKIEIEKQKFYQQYFFWLGKIDQNSVISILPEKIFTHILTLTCAQKPSVNAEKIKQIQKKLDAVIREICQRELIFLLSRSDQHSVLQLLPNELFYKILSDRIELDFWPNKSP